MSSYSEFSLRGVVPAVLTPFTSDNTINVEGIRRFVEFLVERGVDGLYPCGTNGQAQNLSLEERKRVAEAVIEAAPSNMRVVVHVGANSFEDTLTLAKHALDVGAHALAAVTPYYYPYDDTSLIDYYVSLANSVDSPFFLYNIPQRAGNALSVNSLVKITNEAKNVVGIKDSSGDLGYLQDVLDALPRSKLVFNGADHLFLGALALGVSGEVSGLANAYPELFVKLYQAWLSGDMDGARSIQRLLAKLRKILSNPYIEPLFEALRIRGLEIGHVKRPLRRLSDEEAKTLRANLAKLELEKYLKPLA
ncbi:MAG: dihydrodipicolinate synthase family protein [Thermoprotei archaeon]